MKKPTETPTKETTGIVVAQTVSPIERLSLQINAPIVSIRGLTKLGISLAECEELDDVAKKHQLRFRHAKSIVRQLIVNGGINAKEAQVAVEMCLEGVSQGVSCAKMVDIYLETHGDETAIDEAIDLEVSRTLRDRQMWGRRGGHSRGTNKVREFQGKPCDPPNLAFDNPEEY